MNVLVNTENKKCGGILGSEFFLSALDIWLISSAEEMLTKTTLVYFISC